MSRSSPIICVHPRICFVPNFSRHSTSFCPVCKKPWMAGPPDTNRLSDHVRKGMDIVHHTSIMYRDEDIIQFKLATFAHNCFHCKLILRREQNIHQMYNSSSLSCFLYEWNFYKSKEKWPIYLTFMSLYFALFGHCQQ